MPREIGTLESGAKSMDRHTQGHDEASGTGTGIDPAALQAAVDAAFPGLPEGVSAEEAQRRVEAAITAYNATVTETAKTPWIRSLRLGDGPTTVSFDDERFHRNTTSDAFASVTLEGGDQSWGEFLTRTDALNLQGWLVELFGSDGVLG